MLEIILFTGDLTGLWSVHLSGFKSSILIFFGEVHVELKQMALYRQIIYEMDNFNNVLMDVCWGQSGREDIKGLF